MAHHRLKRVYLGTLAAWIGSLFSRRRSGLTGKDLFQAEFKTSSQRMGVRFSERIRRNFRPLWVKRRRDT